jgi:predicted chitinase
MKIGFSSEKLTDEFLIGLDNTLKTFIIDQSLDKSVNNERIAKFIAQISVESEFGRKTMESDYGDKTYFYRTYKSDEKFGDIVDISNGLRRYCGGGYIMLTGKSNYKAFSDAMQNEEIYNQGIFYVAENYAWEATGWWWKSNGMNKYIDNGAAIADVSKRVNGGTNGLGERIAVYDAVISELNR